MKKINRAEAFSGSFEVGGDKSITHRAVMLSSIAFGTSVIKKPLLSEDSISTIDCMKKLGADIQVEDGKITVTGVSRLKDNTKLYCGNSGTTLRLLMGLLSGYKINAELTGDESLSLRPMNRVAEPLSQIGAKISTNNNLTPVKIYPSEIVSGSVKMQVASAQVKSALILAALSGSGRVEIIEKGLSRNHTELMVKSMGGDIECGGGKISVGGSRLKPIEITIPSDISSAAYFLALGALLGKVTVKNVGINTTRAGLLKVFEMMKINFELENQRLEGLEQVADITVYKSEIFPINIGEEIMPTLIDEIPVIAVLCSFASGVSTISGAAELRVKECDRIMATVKMLTDIGGDITETADGFIIKGGGGLKGGTIESFNDHRIAMSGAVALKASKSGGYIQNPDCVNISFPKFYKLLGD